MHSLLLFLLSISRDHADLGFKYVQKGRYFYHWILEVQRDYKNKVINSDAENIILILMSTRYMSSRWYTWDLHIVAIDI